MKLQAIVLGSVALIASLAGGAAFGASTTGSGRAIVTDLKGTATADQRPLSSFSVCYEGETIDVAEGGRLTLVLAGPLVEFVVSGPAKVQLSNNTLLRLAGLPLQQRDLFPGRALQLQTGLIEQASTRTRGEPPPTIFRHLSPNSTLVNSVPVFHWTATDVTGPVAFTLFDADAVPVYTQNKAESGLRLPPSIALKARQHYTWALSGRQVDGRVARSQGNFIVADTSQLHWRRQLGDCSQSASQQVACALLLEQAGFRNDAQRVWQSLAGSASSQPLVRAHQTLEP